MQSLSATCPRDNVETNISCARCGDPICPQCMVYTPVGNKCTGCANIGGPEMFKVGRDDIVKGAIIGTIAALALGVVTGFGLWALWEFPLFEGLPSMAWYIVILVLNAAGAFASGYTLRYVVGLKYSNSLRILAALLGLVFFVAETVTVVQLGIAPIVLNLSGMIGFAVGAYYVMNRFKVPQ